ncbi:uncharacterized protein FYW61_016191 [Anableps anableps]
MSIRIVRQPRRHIERDQCDSSYTTINNNSLHELERLDKEIETVRHEVEQEQRRLSCYQINQADRSSNELVTKFETSLSYKFSSSKDHKSHVQAKKYVVDNSKPRTDLEYDPLSNFSAALRSYRSSGKEHKVKNQQDGKSSGSVNFGEKPSTQGQMYQPPFPEILDDSTEDGVLVIDVSLSPDKTSDQTQNTADLASGKSSQDTERDKKEIKTVNVFLDSRPQMQPAPKQTLIMDQDKGKALSHSALVQNGPSVVQDGEKTSKTAVKTKMKAYINQKQVEAAQEQLLQEEDEAVIIINSSPEDGEDEINYSEMELSDSDPMEECYRIFMEANSKEKGNEEQCGTSVTDMDVEKPEVNATAQPLMGKKRVAHDAKNLEQPLAKTRPQPQVLVPLREPGASGFGSQPSISSKIQQVQQRASMQIAPVKASPNLVSVSQKKPETQTVPSALTPTPQNLQPSPVQNAYLSCIPLGTAVIEVGKNVHLILPQGSFPLTTTSTSSPVTSVLTPVTQVHPNPNAVKQTSAPAAISPLPRYRSTAPVLIAAPARRPALNTAFGSSVQSAVGASTTSQAAAQAAVKPLPVKRKLKQQSEAVKDKVPHDVRQRYVNMFTEEFLKTTADVNEAFEKALTEEKSVYNRSVNKLKYLSIAVNALKRLKNQSATAKSDKVLYEILKGYTLTEEQMIENNYPVQHPEKPGSAVLFSDKKVSADPLKRICCRCGGTYSVNQTGKHLRTEECNYHYGKGVTNRVPGGVETRYSCCQGVMGAPGCQMFKLHVHDYVSLDGFVSTTPRCSSDASCPGVYSLDCEMCYTVQGLELSRVTVINSNLQVIYDTFVRPDNEVIDYNTRFSGISEKDVKGNHTSLREVQETLLSFISADTILVGHGLETDLCLLKLLHGTVVDTSVVFPHRLGPPNKLSLNSLTAEYLRRIIQESVCGHDTGEDAAACMELMLWKMKEDGKLKK